MAPLICIDCESRVSPLEVTCPGCGVLVLDGANTREAPDSPQPHPVPTVTGSPPPTTQHLAATAPPERVCPDCGTPAGDSAALVCVACLREFSPAPATEQGIGQTAADAEDLTRTRRDIRVAAIVVETTGGSARLDPAPAILIGRDLASPVGRLLAAHDNVSRRHAEIRVNHTGVWVSDLGSTNGTYLEGRRLPAGQPTPLIDGSHLRLASNVETVIRVEPHE